MATGMRKLRIKAVIIRAFRVIVRSVAIACSLLFLPIADASETSGSIGVLYSGESTIHESVIAELEKRLNRILTIGGVPRVVRYDNEQLPLNNATHSLWITVGLNAALQTKSLERRTPLVHGLLPKLSLETFLKDVDGSTQSVTGIHLDQPPYRLLNLIKLAIPDARDLGVVLGPSSAESLPELQKHAKRLGLTLHIEQISDQSELIHALERVLQKGQVLLALPDPLIYNRFTVQKILLTTYRRRVPIVAFSAALVRAGATLAVHSSPEQIGRHMAEEAASLLRTPDNGRFRIQAPRYYSVSVNRQVARSLGLNIGEAEELLNSMLELEKQHQ